MKKGLYIRTFGCQMNVYDSGRMADVLAPLGYRLVDTPEDADLVILNTCHIREKATDKVFSDLGQLRLAKQERARRALVSGGSGADGAPVSPLLIAVAGCVAQAEGALIRERAPYVDVVVGPQSYHRLPELVASVLRAAALDRDHSRRAENEASEGAAGPFRGAIDVSFPAEPKFDHLPAPQHDGAVTAFLSIQEGCDKFCSFCVVPYTRGAEYSRPAAEILSEARHLVSLGARELTLLGQNVNAWHGLATDGSHSWRLGTLLGALSEIDGLLRLRYTTSHPRDMDDGLIAAHRDLPKVMPFLHLPVQSGSDAVLAAMNRRHTRDDYLRLIDRLREARPDIALSSDFIVGHPGETDADFEATLDLIRRIGFAQSFSFKYSPRPGTPAAGIAAPPEAVADARLSILQALLKQQQDAANADAVGRRLSVLLERPGRHAGQLTGRTPYFQPVFLEAPTTLIGREVPVDILRAEANSLAGRLADPAGQGRATWPLRHNPAIPPTPPQERATA